MRWPADSYFVLASALSRPRDFDQLTTGWPTERPNQGRGGWETVSASDQLRVVPPPSLRSVAFRSAPPRRHARWSRSSSSDRHSRDTPQGSPPRVRLSSSAHSRRRILRRLLTSESDPSSWLARGSGSPGSPLPASGGAGTTRLRGGDADANTPWHLTRCVPGRGTSAQSRGASSRDRPVAWSTLFPDGCGFHLVRPGSETKNARLARDLLARTHAPRGPGSVAQRPGA